jgi:hypothetical protein
MFLQSKVRPVCTADNLTVVICELTVYTGGGFLELQTAAQL